MMDNDKQKTDAQDADVAELLRHAGDRARPNPEVKQANFEAAREVWLGEVRKQKQQRWALRLLPIAATVLIAAAFFTIDLGQSERQNLQIATVVKQSGKVGIEGSQRLSDLFPGDLLVTHEGGSLSVEFGSVLVVLDETTQATLKTENELFLHHGRIYVDSESEVGSFVVGTALGELVDIGTQFEVVMDTEGLQLAMREGQVQLTVPDGEKLSAVASEDEGDVINLDSDFSSSRGTVARSSQRWNWVEQGIPEYPAGESNLTDVLSWIARQTGRSIRYDKPLTELRVKNEQVTWPALAVEGIEEHLLRISDTVVYRFTFTDTNLVVSAGE